MSGRGSAHEVPPITWTTALSSRRTASDRSPSHRRAGRGGVEEYAGLTGAMTLGAIHQHQLRAQPQAAPPTFDVALVRPNKGCNGMRAASVVSIRISDYLRANIRGLRHPVANPRSISTHRGSYSAVFPCRCRRTGWCGVPAYGCDTSRKEPLPWSTRISLESSESALSR